MAGLLPVVIEMIRFMVLDCVNQKPCPTYDEGLPNSAL